MLFNQRVNWRAAIQPPFDTENGGWLFYTRRNTYSNRRGVIVGSRNGNYQSTRLWNNKLAAKQCRYKLSTGRTQGDREASSSGKPDAAAFAASRVGNSP